VAGASGEGWAYPERVDMVLVTPRP
jgi:hypothetical protein